MAKKTGRVRNCETYVTKRHFKKGNIGRVVPSQKQLLEEEMISDYYNKERPADIPTDLSNLNPNPLQI